MSGLSDPIISRLKRQGGELRNLPERLKADLARRMLKGAEEGASACAAGCPTRRRRLDRLAVHSPEVSVTDRQNNPLAQPLASGSQRYEDGGLEPSSALRGASDVASNPRSGTFQKPRQKRGFVVKAEGAP